MEKNWLNSESRPRRSIHAPNKSREESVARFWEHQSAWPDYADFYGFSLVEFMICIAIVVTLAAIAVPNYIEAVNTAKVVQAMGDIKFIQSEIDMHWITCNLLPGSLEDVGLSDKKDPWGNPYQYLKIAGGMQGVRDCRKDKFLNPLNGDYDLYSKGRDGASEAPLTAKVSRDDVIRAANGSFIGPAENY